MFQNLAPELLALRKKSGLKARDVSRLLGKCNSYMYNCEHGKDLPSADSILRLAALYRTSAKRLFRLARKDMHEKLEQRLLAEHTQALKDWEDADKDQEEFTFPTS